ncbi:uncharacterized protein LOC141702305 [Apium graveolens]|uniref:uncharacterized protein LOC141702305 n=1 Tax=Apium graveolens TaxID=4045 RepID=UPI003D78B33E
MERNTKAYALEGLGDVFKEISLTNIPIIHVMELAIEQVKEFTSIAAVEDTIGDKDKENPNWIQIYKNYLIHGTQPESNSEARILRMKASRFTFINDLQFKKSVTGLLQRCLHKEVVVSVLREVHEGECGNHTAGRNLSLKVLRMGYYWPTLRQDAIDFVKKCDACQCHGPIIHQPS